MTSGPMPSPGRTAMWKLSLASMRCSGGCIQQSRILPQRAPQAPPLPACGESIGGLWPPFLALRTPMRSIGYGAKRAGEGDAPRTKMPLTPTLSLQERGQGATEFAARAWVSDTSSLACIDPSQAGITSSTSRFLLMPRFAANLAYLFPERPLIERFAAAAAAGFRAVELQLPYDHAPAAVKAELDR